VLVKTIAPVIVSDRMLKMRLAKTDDCDDELCVDHDCIDCVVLLGLFSLLFSIASLLPEVPSYRPYSSDSCTNPSYLLTCTHRLTLSLICEVGRHDPCWTCGVNFVATAFEGGSRIR
jgi:hypothetical protein